MKIAGVIAEYNPFHNGHAAQLAQLRRMGAQTIVVCMSGDLVQRGSFAVLPPRVRARLAVENGADLVLSLPNPYACKSAEGFAAAGVALLTAVGCDTLAFGAEDPKADFSAAARVLLGAEYPQKLKELLGGGMSYAAARAAAAGAVSPPLARLLASANNNLGTEYCKAILAQKSPLAPLPLARVEAQHGDAAPLPGSGMASASFLRTLWADCGVQALAPYLPENALAACETARAEGLVPDARAVDLAVLSRLRALNEADLGRVRGMSEGLEHRLYGAICRAGSLEELYALAKTRRYAHARIRRLALDAALGYTEGALPALPPYLHVLAARRRAMPLCKGAALPVSTSLAQLKKAGPEAAAVACAHAAAADLAALCRKTVGPVGQAYTDEAILL